MEHWVEINLSAEIEAQDGILLDVLRPHVRRLGRSGELVSWHYFREPEIRFRVRVRSRGTRVREEDALSRIARGLVKKGLVSEWYFGRHGEMGSEYTGEEDRYGENGWKVAQEYFRDGSENALALLDLRRGSRLESPLWAEGIGNPWEGGARNPWREKEEDPLAYHWSRFVHLFSNQLGFDMRREADLCERQAKGYRRVVDEVGMKW
jgi:hypothetical protein